MSGDKPLCVYGNIQNPIIVRDQQNRTALFLCQFLHQFHHISTSAWLVRTYQVSWLAKPARETTENPRTLTKRSPGSVKKAAEIGKRFKCLLDLLQKYLAIENRGYKNKVCLRRLSLKPALAGLVFIAPDFSLRAHIDFCKRSIAQRQVK
jgi:hypothetical protein